jgi:hypothetical protein
MKTFQLLTEAVKVKGAKTASYTRVSYSSIQDAMDKAYGVSMDEFRFGDDIIIFEKLNKLPTSFKSNGMTFKEVMKDPKGLGLDFFYYLEDRAVGSYSVEQAIEALIAVGALSPGNFIVDIKN